jgi:hypothetical protein
MSEININLSNCRYCLSSKGKLISPCQCTGTIKYIHKKCLITWINQNNKTSCELCNYSYKLNIQNFFILNLFVNIFYNILLWLFITCLTFIIFLGITGNEKKFIFDSDDTGIKFLACLSICYSYNLVGWIVIYFVFREKCRQFFILNFPNYYSIIIYSVIGISSFATIENKFTFSKAFKDQVIDVDDII